ncbi:tRNA (N6-threonylcarbamoyladenosine(37)-N6)-methyltransferase TrmO [Alteromonas gracilis]|uniref:tRNA (N6-threonylcarbamoyladenosine(37)-N6)-methyltransferase TrmO n=1 Tax=Alteromonas gracilis TaxID=1479524 RepID=UPI0030D3048C
MMTDNYSISPIATINTPFKQKFAIPRQPSLANAKGSISFLPGFDDPAMLEGIEGFSHLWLLFIFHQTLPRGWKSKVKAPRLGGNVTTGVLATRSTHRPNGIGMSAVRNLGIEIKKDRTVLNVGGVDLVDATPIVDIKPYLPYSDNVDDATDSLSTHSGIPARRVEFEKILASKLSELERKYVGFKALCKNVLSQDPRPAYKQHIDDDPKTYKVALYDVDIGFVIHKGVVTVTQINQL